MRVLAAFVAAVHVFSCAAPSDVQRSEQRAAPSRLYHADPNHLWNRIHEVFHVRGTPDGQQYGFDTVDPLLWRETRYLLEGASHRRAVAALDEFLVSNAELLIDDPLKRAVFQHDLWTIFDWLAVTSEGDAQARRALMLRLARLMRRVALGRKQIQSLPDSYGVAVSSGELTRPAGGAHQQQALPGDLFSATGPWIAIGGNGPVAPQHAGELGRSAFILLWSVPGGAGATLAYLRKLWDFPQPFVSDPSFQLENEGELRVKVNPALPPVPTGTRIALVRKMMLVDDRGLIVPTNLVQSIQLRTVGPQQTFAEWQMSRQALFAGRWGGLRQVGADQREFLTFSAKGMDPFEREHPGGANAEPARILQGCANCHQTEFGPAIESIRSLRAILRPNAFVDPRHERWARWFTQPITAAAAKSRTYEWGVLQGLWQSLPQ